MKLEDYIKRHTQEAEAAQNAPQVEGVPMASKTLDALAVQLDADRYQAARDLLEDGIDAGEPPADLLHRLTVAVFGEHSPQESKLAETIKAKPGGPELAIATIRGHKAIIRAELKKLQALSQPLMDDLKRLDDEERALSRAAGDTVNKALLEIMEAATAPEPPDLRTLTELYSRYHMNRQAMGLLYGVIADTARKRTGEFDLVAAQHLTELQERVLEAVTA